MAEIKVTLTYIAGVVVANPDPVTLDKDDWISFVPGDNNLYTVIIDSAAIYFKTIRKVLMYDVSPYLDSSSITPTTKPGVASPAGGLKYNVYVTTSDSADRTDPDPDAPPKIIILPHT